MTEHTILVVDDAETNIDILVDLLADDYDVAVAMDGESALEFTVDDAPDLILLDIIMPGIDGYEVCRRLKADPETASIPIIFLSALTQEDEKQKGLELGAVDFLTKPLDAAEIQRIIIEHLPG